MTVGLSPSRPQLTGNKVRTALRLRARPAGVVRQPGVPAVFHYEVTGGLRVGHRREMYRVAISDKEDHRCDCYEDDAIPERFLAIRRMRGCSHVAAAVLARRRQIAIEKAEAVRAAEARLALELESSILYAVPPVNHPMFGQPPLPAKFTAFRNHQWKAIEEVAGLFNDGAKVVLWQAPPGSGKTLGAEAISRLIMPFSGRQRLYIAPTKTLQHQAERDFDYAKLLKGRANYPTLQGNVDSWGRELESGTTRLTAVDCTASPGNPTCRWCDPVVACPYRRARSAAVKADLAILNTSYALTDWGKGGGLFRGRALAIFDEADELEGELLNQVEIVISKAQAGRLNIPPPPYKTTDEKRGRGPNEAWGPWVTEIAIPRVMAKLRQLPYVDDTSATTRQIRQRKSLERLLEGLLILQAELPQGNWIYDGYDRGDIIFRPVQVHEWGKRFLWPHAQHFLLMSGTIISADEMAASLGIPDGYELVDTPMVFDKGKRPINIVALVEMRNKDAETAWPKMARGVRGVMAMHPEERILVHTVSNKLAEYLVRSVAGSVDRGVYTYRNAEERERALHLYKQDPHAVLFASSMDRGVDFYDDLCRVVVWAKMPFPNLGDKRTSQRLYGTPDGDFWYAIQTIRSLVQGTQRHIRSERDYGVTYILDHQFTTVVWKRSKRYLPSWWTDAVDWHFPARRITHPDG